MASFIGEKIGVDSASAEMFLVFYKTCEKIISAPLLHLSEATSFLQDFFL